MANSFLEEEKAKGIEVAEWLVAQKVDVVLLADKARPQKSLRGKGPVYVFRDAGIELRQIESDTLIEAIRGLQEVDH